MKIKATNDNAWVIRELPPEEQGGIAIPDSAKPKVHKGKIITVGKLVSDDTIKAGRLAIFNKSAGFEIEEDGVEYTILRQIDIVGTSENDNTIQ
jgi:co-chaperonin GroES (HSP10)